MIRRLAMVITSAARVSASAVGAMTFTRAPSRTVVAVAAMFAASSAAAQPTVGQGESEARLDSLVWAARVLLHAAPPSLNRVYVDSVNAYATLVSRIAHRPGNTSIAAAAHWRPKTFVRGSSASDTTSVVNRLYDVASQCCLVGANRSTDPTVVAAAGFFAAFVDARRAAVQALIGANLKAFEKKYGPTAPRLSVVEVGLNYLAQRFPAFRPSALGAPSPLEIVANYAPDYLTMVGNDARAVTAAELGFRYYLFGDGWGELDDGGLARPGFAAAGVAVSGGDDGALQSVWRGRPRFGAFIAWGNIKVAAVGVGGPAPRWLVTRQFQKVPWVF